MNSQHTDLIPDRDLASPAQLESFLLTLQDLLRRGVVRPVPASDASVPPIDFAHLAPAGPWPDILEGEFIDAQGRRYHLFVDTYHGAAGTWTCRGVDPP